MIDVADLRSRRRTPGVPTAGERRAGRIAAALSLVALVVAGVLFAGAASHLPAAHLDRQATGEGLRFAPIGLAYVVASALGLPSVVALGVAAGRLARGPRRAARAVAVLSGIAVLVCWALAIWVEWHGDRCIGACG